MAKHKVFKVHPYRKYIILSLFLFLFIGIGYSILGTDLDIFGSISVDKYDKTLYGVLAKETKRGTYAREYTNPHQDSFAQTGTDKIYYWYGSNATNGTAITDKYNVVFAGQCWQMLRTTDTGGVKLLYNGEAENNQCLDTRGNHVGYVAATTKTLLPTYYYGSNYEFDGESFMLTGSVTAGSRYPGRYTCLKATANETCSELYLVFEPVSGNTYNVIPLNNESSRSVFGKVQYNMNYNALADLGYMRGERIANETMDYLRDHSIYNHMTLVETAWYADSITWNTTTSKWELDNPYQVSDPSELVNMHGKYTFDSEDQNYSSSSASYIVYVEPSHYNAQRIKLYSGHDIDYYNEPYIVGTEYVINNDGTYSIVNGETIYSSDLAIHFSSIKSKYVCYNSLNNRCEELWYIYSTPSAGLEYVPSDYFYKYANGYTYANGIYTLNNVSVSEVVPTKNAHYTCFNESGVCSDIHYVIYFDNIYKDDEDYHYLSFSGGDGIDYYLQESLRHNAYDSTIKFANEAWYKKYINDYNRYVDDVIYCDDRGYNIEADNFFNPNGGNISGNSNLVKTSLLNCPSIYDQFSVANPDAELKYPVGLMTYNEMVLLSNSNSRKASDKSWLISSYLLFDDYGTYFAIENYLASDGKLNTYRAYNEMSAEKNFGLRPVISLKKGTEFNSGDGSKNSPYLINMIG